MALISSAAFAETNVLPAGGPAPVAQAKTVATAVQTHKIDTSFQQQVTADVKQVTGDLQQAGFTNIKVMPGSLLVQATDKSGHPMTIVVGPDSITVMSEADSGQPLTGAGIFTSVPKEDDLSSQVIGLDVYNGANQNIGTIKDIAFDTKGIKAYIVGVGGFIGMGEHHVAMRPSAIVLKYNAGEKRWHATSDINADQLKAAPDSMRVNAQPNTGGMFTSIQAKDDLNSQGRRSGCLQ